MCDSPLNEMPLPENPAPPANGSGLDEHSIEYPAVDPPIEYPAIDPSIANIPLPIGTY